MAKLLVRLSNYGVKIIITTHSDFLLKEINNRIMAFELKDKNVLDKLMYIDNDIISIDRVNAFTVKKNGFIKEINKDKYGISSDLFDEAIIDIEKRSDFLISEFEKALKNDK